MVVASAAWATGPEAANEKRYTGYAYALDRDVLLFVEEHHERVIDEQITHRVEYRDSENALIVEKHIDYSACEIAPSFLARDLRTGRVEGAQPGSHRLELIRGQGMGEKRELRKPKGLVVDAGFDHFILANWDALTAGKRLRLTFAAPALFRCIDFVIFEESRPTIAGQRAHRFRMRTDSLLFRLFTDPIDVSYCAETKRLLAYEGLTGIEDDHGNNHKARIVFPEPGERPEDYLISL